MAILIWKKDVVHIQDNGDIFSISGKTDAVTLLTYINWNFLWKLLI